jgi:hypothetical protein
MNKTAICPPWCTCLPCTTLPSPPATAHGPPARWPGCMTGPAAPAVARDRCRSAFLPARRPIERRRAGPAPAGQGRPYPYCVTSTSAGALGEGERQALPALVSRTGTGIAARGSPPTRSKQRSWRLKSGNTTRSPTGPPSAGQRWITRSHGRTDSRTDIMSRLTCSAGGQPRLPRLTVHLVRPVRRWSLSVS